MEIIEQSTTIKLGKWEIRPAELRVIDGDVEHVLEAKVMEVLVALLEHPGQVIKREALIDRVWGREFGGDESLTRAISLLRKALGDTRGSHEHIRTIPRQGYQLVAPVEVSDLAGTADTPIDAASEPIEDTRTAPNRSNWIAVISASLLVLAALVNFGSDLIDNYSNKPPLIVIMDSAHPSRIYDQSVYTAGGTNADTLSDILSDLPVQTQKELISPNWNRYEAIAQFDPELILIHYSGFKQEDASGPRPKLKLLIEYFIESDTRFLIYSRAGQGWLDNRVEAVIADLVTAHPEISDRVTTHPLLEYGEASWLDQQSALAVKLKIKKLLEIE